MLRESLFVNPMPWKIKFVGPVLCTMKNILLEDLGFMDNFSITLEVPRSLQLTFSTILSGLLQTLYLGSKRSPPWQGLTLK